jgi:hypothetical protein
MSPKEDMAAGAKWMLKKAAPSLALERRSTAKEMEFQTEPNPVDAN